METTAFAGLSSREARARLARFGENNIFHTKREHALVSFLKKFQSPLLILLAGAAFLSILLGQTTSGVIIIVMIFLSAVLDFINTYRSERVAEALAEKIVVSAPVFRDGKKVSLPIKHIVPGDLVMLTAGSVIPADGVLVEGDDVFTNESALTGESFPVGKAPLQKGAVPEKSFSAPSNGTPNSLYMGSSVTTGFGTMLVLKTGASAFFGNIAQKLSEKNPETDFEKGLRHFSFLIMRITALMVGFVFLVNIVKGSHQILDSLIFAIAIAVGLTPELLPVIMTVTLSKGSLRMAKKHAVVRTLPAIQNLGAMTILATDKTGTLTEDHITLVSCVDVAGNDSDAVFSHAYLSSIFHTQRTSPLDTAIRAFRSLDTSEYKKVDEVPFDFSRKRDSIVYDHKSTRYLVVKGAPEGMFPVCTLLEKNGETIPFSTTLREEARTRYNALSANGFRVLALAYKKIPQATQSEYTKEEECDLIFLGFSAFMDPPKESAKEALRSLAELGVSVKIITGDSEVLTERICRDIGLPIEGVLSGEQIAHMSDTQLATLAPHTTVFARVPPDGKERVVRALRAQGAVVGYLGDGINDAPALKMADVGISVNNAVDVAKETADVILLTKGLDILADGIREGRITFQNTMKYVRMAFSSNFGNMASMSVASAALPFLPMSPAQILLNNFLYDLSQTSLPSDRVDADDLKKPLSWNMKDIRHYMITFGLVSSLFDCATFFLLFKVFGLTDGAFQTGWFIESIATQILVVFIIRTKKFPLFAQAPSRGVLATTFGIIVIASLIPFTFLGAHLGFIPLTTHTMLAIVAIVACYLVVAEVTKYLFYKSERATK